MKPLIVPAMPSPKQIRAARALLGWTQATLSDRAVVAPAVIKRVESGKDVRASTMRSICQALAKAGIRFTVGGNGSEAVTMLRNARVTAAASIIGTAASSLRP